MPCSIALTGVAAQPSTRPRWLRSLAVPGQRLHLDTSIECRSSKINICEVCVKSDHEMQAGRRTIDLGFSQLATQRVDHGVTPSPMTSPH